MSVVWAEPFTSSAPRTKKRKDTPAERKHTRDEWEARRDRISELFEEHELPDVAAIMADEGFEASIPQYRIRLKNWGHWKYLKLTEKQWRYIGQKLMRREKDGKGGKTAFRLNGKKIPSARLEKELGVKVREDDFDLASLCSAMSVSASSVSAYTTSTTQGVKTSYQRAREEEADRVDGAETSSPNASRMRLFRRLLQAQKQLRATEMELRETQRQLAATEAEAEVWYTKEGFTGESQSVGAIKTVQCYYNPIIEQKAKEIGELGGNLSGYPFDVSGVLRRGYEGLLEDMDREIPMLPRRRPSQDRVARQIAETNETRPKKTGRRSSNGSPRARRGYAPLSDGYEDTRISSASNPVVGPNLQAVNTHSPYHPFDDPISTIPHDIQYHFDPTVPQEQLDYFSFFHEAQDGEDCDEELLSVRDVLDDEIWNDHVFDDINCFTYLGETNGQSPGRHGSTESQPMPQHAYEAVGGGSYWDDHASFFGQRHEITT